MCLTGLKTGSCFLFIIAVFEANSRSSSLVHGSIRLRWTWGLITSWFGLFSFLSRLFLSEWGRPSQTWLWADLFHKSRVCVEVLLISASAHFPHPAWIKDQNGLKVQPSPTSKWQPNVASPFHERLASPTVRTIAPNRAQRPRRPFEYMKSCNTNLSGHMSRASALNPQQSRSNAHFRSGNVSAPTAKRPKENIIKLKAGNYKWLLSSNVAVQKSQAAQHRCRGQILMVCRSEDTKHPLKIYL